MFLEFTAIGLIIGLVRGGKLSNLAFVKFRGWILIIIGFLLNLHPLYSNIIPIINSYQKYLNIFGMILIFLTLLLNIDKKGIWIISIGALMNIIVVIVNGLKMPIYFEGLKLAGLDNMLQAIKSKEIVNYMDLEEAATWTKYLGKFIVLPKPYPLSKVISIGDLIMSLGIIQFLQGEMNRTYYTMKSRMINMGYKIKL